MGYRECTSCRGAMPDNLKTCPHCGAVQAVETQESKLSLEVQRWLGAALIVVGAFLPSIDFFVKISAMGLIKELFSSGLGKYLKSVGSIDQLAAAILLLSPVLMLIGGIIALIASFNRRKTLGSLGTTLSMGAVLYAPICSKIVFDSFFGFFEATSWGFWLTIVGVVLIDMNFLSTENIGDVGTEGATPVARPTYPEEAPGRQDSQPIRSSLLPRSVCSQCGASLGQWERFCGACGGAARPTEPTRCSRCGASMGQGDKFCGSCGGTPANSD